jgi:hypothetical protein
MRERGESTFAGLQGKVSTWRESESRRKRRTGRWSVHSFPPLVLPIRLLHLSRSSCSPNLRLFPLPHLLIVVSHVHLDIFNHLAHLGAHLGGGCGVGAFTERKPSVGAGVRCEVCAKIPSRHQSA